VFASLTDEALPLPKNLQPYLIVANIDFVEGPIFDSRGNLYFVNYLRNGTLGKMARDGTFFIRYVWAVGVGEMIYARTSP